VTIDFIKRYKKMSLAHNPKRYKPRPMLSPSEHAQEQLMREHAQEMESIQIFATISEAFDVLTDPLRKAIYDQFGERALKEGMPGPKGFIPPYAYHGDPYATFRYKNDLIAPLIIFQCTWNFLSKLQGLFWH